MAGRLRLWAGNIAVHVLDCEFLARAADANRLRLHRTRRSVACVSGHDSKRPTEPDQPNAWQFERFIFFLAELSDDCWAPTYSQFTEWYGHTYPPQGEPMAS